MKQGQEARSRWWTFVAVAVFCVTAVFGLVSLLEKTVFENAPFEKLRHLYMIRGASASFLVLVAAGLFFQARHRATDERLRKLDRLKDELIGTVSHEIRTPLAVIKMSTANLKDGLAGSLKKEQQELVETIERHSERLQRIINEVLDLTRLESGRSRVKSRPVSAGPFLHEVVANFRVAAEKRDVTLEMDLPPRLPDVSGDSDMLNQVLANLLENAIRYARKKVTVKADVLNEEVRVTVSDDGAGIVPEDLGRLFSKFERINSPRNHDKGTGLGLAIAREIVRQHGGRIWAESRIGQGAQFHFTIPMTGGTHETIEEKGPYY